MAWIAPIVAAGASLYGNSQAQQEAKKAEKARRQALEAFMNIDIPDIKSQEVNYLGPEYVGDFQAQQEQALALDPSSMEQVSTDPRLQQAQMAALQQLTDISQSGLLPGEEAALRQSRRGAAGEAQAKSAQLQDEFARRGMGGSGAELAARLQAGQSGAQRQSEEGDRLMQMAQQRALSAIGQSASLAGNVRQQSFGEQSDVARAKDAIKSFNTQNQQSVQQRNVGANNQAGLRNLETKQGQANDLMKIKNSQQDKNKALIQQQYNNQIKLAAGKAGQLKESAEGSDKNAAGIAGMWNGIGREASTAISGNQQKNNKSQGDFSTQDEDYRRY